MALPPSAVEQMTRDPVRTPGWSGRLLMFSATLLFLAAISYAGLKFGYEPYLMNRIEESKSEMTQLAGKADERDQTNILSFHSQLVNVRNLIESHVYPTGIFEWLEAATHPSIYFTKFDFKIEKRTVSLVGVAKTVKDVTEQIQIFEKRPETEKAQFSNVSALATGGWQFDAVVTLKTDTLRRTLPDALAENDDVLASTTSFAASSSASTTTSTP